MEAFDREWRKSWLQFQVMKLLAASLTESRIQICLVLTTSFHSELIRGLLLGPWVKYELTQLVIYSPANNWPRFPFDVGPRPKYILHSLRWLFGKNPLANREIGRGLNFGTLWQVENTVPARSPRKRSGNFVKLPALPRSFSTHSPEAFRATRYVVILWRGAFSCLKLKWRHLGNTVFELKFAELSK